MPGGGAIFIHHLASRHHEKQRLSPFAFDRAWHVSENLLVFLSISR
jgi:hypothetical protein